MIGVALVGAGHWGPNLLRNFHNFQRSKVVWVVDSDSDRLDEVAARYPDVALTSSIESALGDSRVQAAVIATPTSTHFTLAKKAIEAGKHVLVEKPITTRSDEASELCGIADGHGTVLMVGHVFVYNAGVRKVKELLDSNDLGRIYYIAMTRTNLGPIRTDVGSAWDLAAHDVSIANYWLDDEPLTASAMAGNWINNGINDATFATLRYPNDILVHLHASWLNPRKARDITVVGARSMLTLDDMNLVEPLRIYDKGVSDDETPGFVDTFAAFRASVWEGSVTIPKVSMGEPLKEECDHFLSCIEGDAKPITDGHMGLGVVRVLEAIERSITERGREQEVRL